MAINPNVVNDFFSNLGKPTTSTDIGNKGNVVDNFFSQFPVQKVQPSPQPITPIPKQDIISSTIEKGKELATKTVLPLVQHIPGFIKSYAMSIKKEPIEPIAGLGKSLMSQSLAIANLIKKGIEIQPQFQVIGAVANKVGITSNIPNRWDLSKQFEAYKELDKMRLAEKGIDAQRANSIGEFIGSFYKYTFASSLAEATVGKAILTPIAAKFAPKVVKLVPKISDIIGFTGVGQLDYDQGADGTRVDRLKNDVIMLGLFEVGGTLAKGISKGTSNLISKAVNKVSSKLKTGKSVAIDELEKTVNEAKQAVIKDTGKPAEVILANNITQASDKELKLLSAPQPSKLLKAPKEQYVSGQGFEMTAKADKQKVEVMRKINDFEEAKMAFNKNSTPRNLDKLQKARLAMNDLQQKDLVREVKKPAETITPPEIKAKEVKVPREQLPVGEGKEKISRLEARITQSLEKAPQEIKDKLGSVTYKEMGKKENISKAVDYVTKNPEEALAVLKGEKEAPKGILRNSIYVAMQNQAEGDVALARKLASLSSTRAGQEISILTEIDPDSPVKLMSDLVKIREEAFKKRYGGKPVNEVSTDMIKKAKGFVKKPDKWDWTTFINSIECT